MSGTLFFKILTLAFLLSQELYSQIDSIEYNILSQIHDFEISNNKYYFRDMKGKIIETDSLIFHSDLYFANYPIEYIPDYLDSIEFIIASRTLKKSYGENVLFDKSRSYIRISWFKDKYPIFIRINDLNAERLNIHVKIGDGFFLIHGNVLEEFSVELSESKSRAIKRIIDNNNLGNLSHGINAEVEHTNNFYLEIKNNEKFNNIIIGESYIKDFNNRKFYKLYKKLLKYIIKENQISEATKERIKYQPC